MALQCAESWLKGECKSRRGEKDDGRSVREEKAMKGTFRGSSRPPYQDEKDQKKRRAQEEEYGKGVSSTRDLSTTARIEEN